MDEFLRLELGRVLTQSEPFGPPQSEALISIKDVFMTLYSPTNLLHVKASDSKPSYIIGRRGAGKTAFLIGTSIASDSNVIRIRSEDIYTEIDKIIKEHNTSLGALMADLSCHIWEVIISHAAIFTVVKTSDYETDYDDLWSYIRTFGDEENIQTDVFLAQVARDIRNAIFDESHISSFRIKCRSISREGFSFENAMTALAKYIKQNDYSIVVVVDNLDDLSGNIHLIEDPLKALLRFVAREKDSDNRIELPFRSQFCFPSEILPKLYEYSANPEKDLRHRLTIQWHAKELLQLIANRFAYFISANNLWQELPEPWSQYSSDELPLEPEFSIEFIRDLLPKKITNGYNIEEDPIAYILRHTQLLPRHMIIIFNYIFSNWALTKGQAISEQRVIKGVAEAEDVLAPSTMSAYKEDYPYLTDAVSKLRNLIPQTCIVKDMHSIYNRAGGSKSGMGFDGFLEALLTIGAVGIWRRSTERYEVAEFAYTLREVLPSTNINDRVCIHPLFLKRFHDRSSISKMREDGHKPIYPHGADPSDGEYRQW